MTSVRPDTRHRRPQGTLHRRSTDRVDEERAADHERRHTKTTNRSSYPKRLGEYRIHPYATVMREGDIFRLWYLAYEWDPPAGVELPVTGTAEDAGLFWEHTRGRLCYAESADGVHWERPNLGLVEYRGSGDNNILGPAVHDPVRQAGWNAGTVFRDPTAPPEQRYKLWSEIKVGEEGKSGLTGFLFS